MLDAWQRIRLVHRALRYRWRLDRREIKAMLGLLPAGGTAIDIGAHKGAYAWWMARRVGPAGRVVCIEPQQRVVDGAARSFAAAGLKQVRYIRAAASDHLGTARIDVRQGSTHGASLEGLSGVDIVKEDVPLVTIDALVRQQGLERLDFIKIDVEGHELAVVKGGHWALERFGPALLVECEARHHAGAANPVTDLQRLLAPLGYRGEFFLRRERAPIERFDIESHQQYGRGFYSNNFLFTRR